MSCARGDIPACNLTSPQQTVEEKEAGDVITYTTNETIVGSRFGKDWNKSFL